jgi:hypothetical protein
MTVACPLDETFATAKELYDSLTEGAGTHEQKMACLEDIIAELAQDVQGDKGRTPAQRLKGCIRETQKKVRYHANFALIK